MVLDMLRPEVLLPLAGYSVSSSITPGPNNIMLLTSGMNFGFRRTIPHSLGVSIGFFVLLVAVGLGVGALLAASDVISTVIKVASFAYMLYLAFRIATAAPMSADAASKSRPMTFLEACGFQWVNPKAWVMAIGAMAAYTDKQHPLASMLYVAVVFGLINYPCVAIWVGLGDKLRQWLTDPRISRAFNVTMAILLVASFVLMMRK